MFHDVSTKWGGVVCKFRPRNLTALGSLQLLIHNSHGRIRECSVKNCEKLIASAVCETTPLPIPTGWTPYGRFASLDVPFMEPLELLDVRRIKSADFCNKCGTLVVMKFPLAYTCVRFGVSNTT